MQPPTLLHSHFTHCAATAHDHCTLTIPCPGVLRSFRIVLVYSCIWRHVQFRDARHRVSVRQLGSTSLRPIVRWGGESHLGAASGLQLPSTCTLLHALARCKETQSLVCITCSAASSAACTAATSVACAAKLTAACTAASSADCIATSSDVCTATSSAA